MIELKGKYNTAKIFTDNVDNETISQLMALLNQEFVKDSKIRIMPDTHAGKGCVIGTTMTIKDKIIPNLVGVDIGCLDKDTEILTPNGWIKISEYNNQDILVYDKLNQVARFEKPLAYIKNPCDKFYHFHHSNGLDQMFSSEHKMLLWKGYRSKGYNQEIMLAEDFVNSTKDLRRLDYTGTKTTFAVENQGLDLSDIMIRLLVMISADGRVRYNKDKTKTYVELHFKKERKIKRAENLLSDAKIKYSKSLVKDGSTFISFTLNMFYDKSLEMFFKATSKELAVLCDEIYFWDGTIDDIRNHKCYSSTNKLNIDVVQFALATQGIRAGISINVPKNKNWNIQYGTYETNNQIVSYNNRDSISIVDSIDGYKYCFTTPTGFFVIRRNNCISITGNCGMLAVKLKEHKINMQILDNVINTYVPAGFDIHETPVATSNIDKIYAPVNVDKAYKSLGTLGGGNHFIEVDKDENNDLWLVIHTGSRHLGIEVCDYYQNLAYESLKNKAAGEDIKTLRKELIARLQSEGREKDISKELTKLNKEYKNAKVDIPYELAYLEGKNMENYLHDMALAQEHAKINRQTIANIILKKAKLHEIESFDTIHNYIDIDSMILRKGSISARFGEKVLIPINMRDGSLICIGKGNEDFNFSAPHGAGRLMSRSKAKENISMQDFKASMDGIYTTSVDTSTLDEAPQAYKPMGEIIENIKDTVDIVSIIKPIYNFKAHDKAKALEIEQNTDYER